MESNSQLEHDLWLRYSQGDRDAQTDLFVRYASLVDQIVKQMKRCLPGHVLADELRASGLEGLWKAMRGYDFDNEVPFESYARIRIRGTILDELRRMDDLSRSKRGQLKQAQAAYGAQSQATAYKVSIDDERLEWIVDDSAVSPEEAAVRSNEIAELNQALVRLSEQEQLVLAMVFNEGLNLVETAEVMSLSRSRVGTIYNKALKSLKGSLLRKQRKKP